MLAADQALGFPFAQPPDDGTMVEVAAGVFWLRMPLPFPPGHINLYCLAEPDGSWTVLDCGVDDQASRDVWTRLEGAELGGRPISRVLVSHWHADHSGLAGWLAHRHRARVLMAASEYLLCRGRSMPAAGWISRAWPASWTIWPAGCVATGRCRPTSKASPMVRT